MLDPRDLDRAIDSLADKAEIDEPDALLETAEILTRFREIEPSSERRAQLRERFLARGQELGAARRQARQGPFSRWRLLTARRIAAATAMLVLSSGSAVYAASDSMPNSPLYPLKRTSETIALSVTTGKTKNHLQQVFARKRLQEANHLLETPGNSEGHSPAIPLLVEARKSGDLGLKNQVDELLKGLANNKSKGKKAVGRPDSAPGSKQPDPGDPAIRSGQPRPGIKNLPKAPKASPK